MCARVFISYRTQEPDRGLAAELHHAITAAGHYSFLAEESIRWGENWPQRIEDELRQCDFFLLLLSPDAKGSEMVAEEVRRARELQQMSEHGRPHILPLRVNLGMGEPIGYDLGGYLNRLQQREWRSEADTPRLVEQFLDLLAGREPQDAPHTPGPAPVAVESADSPPLPASPPELPGGQVVLASHFYIERPRIEEETFAEVRKPGSLVCVKGPRQMGKTSLMARLVHEARQGGCRAVTLDLQLEDGAIFADLDLFLRWWCSAIGEALGLENMMETAWVKKPYITLLSLCRRYFVEHILRKTSGPIFVAMDEVDRMFEHPAVVNEFFGLLRGWYDNLAKNDEEWRRLRVAIVHSTESYADPDIHRSPLENVGLHVKLPEFTAAQVSRLAGLHRGLSLSAAQLDALMRKVGGHPYLVRVALYRVARGETTLEALLDTAATESGVYGDHLRRHLWTLTRDGALAGAMRRVAQADGPVRLDALEAFKLEGMGLVRREGNDVRVRCDLYRDYFRQRL